MCLPTPSTPEVTSGAVEVVEADTAEVPTTTTTTTTDGTTETPKVIQRWTTKTTTTTATTTTGICHVISAVSKATNWKTVTVTKTQKRAVEKKLQENRARINRSNV